MARVRIKGRYRPNERPTIGPPPLWAQKAHRLPPLKFASGVKQFWGRGAFPSSHLLTSTRASGGDGIIDLGRSPLSSFSPLFPPVIFFPSACTVQIVARMSRSPDVEIVFQMLSDWAINWWEGLTVISNLNRSPLVSVTLKSDHYSPLPGSRLRPTRQIRRRRKIFAASSPASTGRRRQPIYHGSQFMVGGGATKGNLLSVVLNDFCYFCLISIAN